MKIFVDSKKCTGCKICEIVCSIKFERKVIPSKARIKVISFYPPGTNQPIVCRQCASPPCEERCPVNALSVRKEGGVMISEEKCIGCRVCVEACQFGAMMFDAEKKLPFVCNECDGDPECAKYCPTGALTFSNPSSFIILREKERFLGIKPPFGPRS